MYIKERIVLLRSHHSCKYDISLIIYIEKYTVFYIHLPLSLRNPLAMPLRSTDYFFRLGHYCFNIITCSHLLELFIFFPAVRRYILINKVIVNYI
jgi:hypothetical protein